MCVDVPPVATSTPMPGVKWSTPLVTPSIGTRLTAVTAPLGLMIE